MDLLLTNTIFDRENDNVLLFNNKAELAQYFNNKQDKVIINNVNFNAGDLIDTSVNVKVNDNLDLFKILNYNYCVVLQGNGKSNLYYFIEKSSQDSGPFVKLNLTIDVINTYIYDILGENSTTQGLVQRTHLDRFIKQNDKFIYNFNATSPLFERETLKNVSKRVVEKQKLNVAVDLNENSSFNNFINENIICWEYFFLKSNVKYNYKQNDTKYTENLTPLYYTIQNIETGRGQYALNSNFVVLAIPVYKESTTLGGKCINIKHKNGNIETWDPSVIDYFLQENNNYANIESIKFSIFPPIEPEFLTENINYSFDENGNLIFHNYGNYAFGYFLSAQDEGATNSVFMEVTSQNLNKDIVLYLNKNFDIWEFNSQEITNENEPKMLNEDYSLYKLFFGGQQYDLPISKTSNKPKFRLREIISPDITKASVCFDTTSTPEGIENKVFKNETMEDFTGFNLTLDLSMWFPSEALQNYLASNKNYLQIFNNQQTYGKITSLNDAVSRIVTGATLGVPMPLNTSLGSTLIKQTIDRANMELTLDNMANTPATTNNLNSDAMLINNVSGLNLFIEKLEILPFERSIIIDNLKMFGYNYNKIDYLKNYIKTRKYYNYIESILFDIDAQIAEQVKDKIKTTFKNGVRFWHADAWEDVEQMKIDFNLNNIERSIEQWDNVMLKTN